MSLVPNDFRRWTLVSLVAVSTLACKGKEPEAAPDASGMTIGHLLNDSISGVMLDLPASWRGRYRLSDSVSRPTAGLQRELAMRYVKADSTDAAQWPMLVAIVFDKAAWAALPSDSVRSLYGQPMADDATRVLVLRRATETPFPAGTADAGAYDSLMTALFSRPLRSTLRPPTAPRGPGAPAASSP